MTSPGELRFRAATADDAPAVAALHADSWRRHYRGAFSDSFLDGDVGGYLLDRWAGRLAAPDPQARTIVAEAAGELVGLSHIVLGEHPEYGALLDNLHVAYGRKRLGIGTRLMAETGRTVLECAPGSGLHLWALEQNTAARAFYTARGGVCVETAVSPPPGGDPSRLNGRPKALRFVWPDPSTLL